MLGAQSFPVGPHDCLVGYFPGYHDELSGHWSDNHATDGSMAGRPMGLEYSEYFLRHSA